MKTGGAAFLAFVLSLTPSLGAAAEPSQAVQAQVRYPLNNYPMTTGYSSAVVRLTHAGAGSRRIEIRAEAGGRTIASRFVELGGGESLTAELPLPRYAFLSGYRLLVDDGSGKPVLEDTVAFTSPWRRANGAEQPPAVLVVSERPLDLRGLKAALPDSSSSGVEMAYEIQPADLPLEWASWVGIDLVALDARLLPRLDPAAREALARYVETGGIVVLADAAQLHGEDLRRLLPGTGSASPGGWTACGMGCVALEGDNLFGTDAASWTGLFERLRKENRKLMAAYRFAGPRGDDYGYYRGQEAWPHIPGIGGVPARTFAGVVILFAVLAGPVNFLLLGRMKRMHLAIVTIPALSAAAVALLVCYAFFSEGFGVKVVPRTLTWLDQGAHRAAAFTKTGYYASLSPGGGLRFEPGTAAFPTVMRYDGHPPGRVDWTGGVRLGPGWVPGRTPVEFATLQCGPCRQRLQFAREGTGRVRVANGLDAHLKALYFRLPDGEAYFLTGLAPGASAAAARWDAPPPAGAPPRPRGCAQWLKEFMDEPLLKSWDETPLLSLLDIRPGTFAAVADRSVFAGCGLERPELLPGLHLVRGDFALEGE